MNNNGVNNISNGNNIGVSGNTSNTTAVPTPPPTLGTTNQMSYGANVRIAPPVMNGQGTTTTNTSVNATSTVSSPTPSVTPTVISTPQTQSTQTSQTNNSTAPNGNDAPTITTVIEAESKEAPNVQFITKKSKVAPVLFIIVLILTPICKSFFNCEKLFIILPPFEMYIHLNIQLLFLFLAHYKNVL